MKLKFKNQQFHTDAVKAIKDVFLGQTNALVLEFSHYLSSFRMEKSCIFAVCQILQCQSCRKRKSLSRGRESTI